MADFDDQLSAILGNPEIMGKIMSMADSINHAAVPSQDTRCEPPEAPPETASLQSMLELLGKTKLDSRQQNLVQSLRGFLPEDRVFRLQKAMQAAKIARYAAVVLNQAHQSGR